MTYTDDQKIAITNATIKALDEARKQIKMMEREKDSKITLMERKSIYEYIAFVSKKEALREDKKCDHYFAVGAGTEICIYCRKYRSETEE